MKSENDTIVADPVTIAPDTPLRDMLQQVIVNNLEKHPERTNATLERIREVLELIFDEKADANKLYQECQHNIQGKYDEFAPLNDSDGRKVAEILAGGLSDEQGYLAAKYIFESEISTDEVVKLHKKFKIPVSHLEDDLLPVRGAGAQILDSKGNAYVDLDSNYSATNLGNANAEIARGLYNQASLLISQKEDRIQVARARFLREIGDMMPGDLTNFYWQNSGGEAVDKSIKIAKAFTKQKGVVAFKGGFHGRTHGAVAITYNKAYREPFMLDDEPWVHFVPFGDLDAVEAHFKNGDAKIAMLELVQGEEAGINPATPEFATGLRKLCDKYEAVMIADEVQTGFGRVAEHEGQWFASHRYNVVPDIITIGKSFGGGYPVTAVVSKPHISQAMKPGYDGSTFGGNPMAMVSAYIATRQMKQLNLTANTVERSKQFSLGLSQIESPKMKGFRTIGLMIGIDLDSPETVARVQEAMKKHGAHSSLSTGATLRWMPPLVITRDETNQVLEAFRKALDDIG